MTAVTERPRPSIIGLWREYAERIVPADAGLIQRQETRRTFYTAVWLTLETLKELADLPDDDDVVAILEAMSAEYEGFIKLMDEGKA